MFKKLRNRLLIVNTMIIASLVLGSFSVIFIVTAQNTERGIDRKIEMALNGIIGEHTRDQMPVDMKKNKGDRPEEIPPDDIGKKYTEKQPFSFTFSLITDNEGNITEKNIPFEINDFYSEKINEIINDDDGTGRIKTDTSYWKYKAVPIESGFAVVFTEIYVEHNMLRNLFFALLFVALIALSIAFLISLFSANRSIRPVEESYNKQKQFVADASHELKTPLTTINTNIDVLLSHTDSTIGEERKWLDYIKSEAQRMTKLTNDLLYLARLDYDENKVMLDKVSFSDAAENVLLLMEAVAFENDVLLDYDIESDVYINSSNEQAKQLVMILLDNAVKYTPKNGNIKIKLKTENSNAVFSVWNSGEGISDVKHIFERFYREDKSRSRESGGYGLGLAIAKAIVTQSKGEITVSSVKNKFTEFVVKIPVAK